MKHFCLPPASPSVRLYSISLTPSQVRHTSFLFLGIGFAEKQERLWDYRDSLRMNPYSRYSNQPLIWSIFENLSEKTSPWKNPSTLFGRRRRRGKGAWWGETRLLSLHLSKFSLGFHIEDTKLFYIQIQNQIKYTNLKLNFLKTGVFWGKPCLNLVILKISFN